MNPYRDFAPDPISEAMRLSERRSRLRFMSMALVAGIAPIAVIAVMWWWR